MPGQIEVLPLRRGVDALNSELPRRQVIIPSPIGGPSVAKDGATLVLDGLAGRCRGVRQHRRSACDTHRESYLVSYKQPRKRICGNGGTCVHQDALHLRGSGALRDLSRESSDRRRTRELVQLFPRHIWIGFAIEAAEREFPVAELSSLSTCPKVRESSAGLR